MWYSEVESGRDRVECGRVGVECGRVRKSRVEPG